MIEATHPQLKQNWRQLWRTLFSFVFTRGFIVWVLLLGEVALVIALINNFFTNALSVYISTLGFSFVTVVFLISRRYPTAFKLAWTAFILVTPPVGGVIYLFYELSGVVSRRRYSTTDLPKALTANLRSATIKTADLPVSVRQQLTYLGDSACFPAYECTRTRYFPLGEDFFAQLKKDLLAAKKFIFMEYYIITPGKMWNEILEILHQKASDGVEVRLMYDDFGSLFSLPTNYSKTLASMGIRTAVLNRFRPFIIFQMNNRDHRKITVIDGKVAFTGGLNLADEYINAIDRYGHWKDTAIRVEGPAVDTFTTVYLQMWNSTRQSDDSYAPYLLAGGHRRASDGIVVPFADDPFISETVAHSVYFSLITNAQRSLWLTTPYLVPDDELTTALSLAAKRGVDVKVIIPANGDHWYVHLLSQAFCLPLLEAGVKVYEYTPGFIHSKTMIADDQEAVVGSINFDFRSLFLLYEAGVYTYNSQAVTQLKRDLTKTLNDCRLMELADVKEVHLPKRITRSLLRLVAPLI